MIEDKIELNIITYNRAAALDRTLGELKAGPFANCKITVLDNCSTDETPDVCARHQELLNDFHVIRHQKNLGLSANYLRAVEISTSLYTWVLCDDDYYDWSQCQDVVDAIEEGQVDWVCVGGPGQQEWEKGLRTTTRALWKRGARFFFVHTFFPAIIFKTERFDSECLTLGYHNAQNAYPNHRFVSKALEQNFSEYVARHPVVRRDPQVTVHPGLHWLTIAFNSSATIPDPHARRLALYEATTTRFSWLMVIAQHIVLGKLAAPHKVPRQYLQLVLACVGEQRMRILLLAPLALMPRGVYITVRRVWRLLSGRKSGYTDIYSDKNTGGEASTSGDASVDFFRG